MPNDGRSLSTWLVAGAVGLPVAWCVSGAFCTLTGASLWRGTMNMRAYAWTGTPGPACDRVSHPERQHSTRSFARARRQRLLRSGQHRSGRQRTSEQS